MTTYTRTETVGAFRRITEVSEDGRYKQIVIWQDGTITSAYRSTVQGMGWESVANFLRNRNGFIS